MVLVWGWATLLLPLLHSFHHQLDHVHGPFGVTYFLEGSEHGASSHRHHDQGSHHDDHDAHSHHHHEPSGEWHHHHDASLTDSKNSRGNDGHTQSRGSPKDDDERPNRDGDHGSGSIQHFGAIYTESGLVVSPAAIAAQLEFVLPRATGDDLPFRQEARLLRCRSPPGIGASTAAA